ncbi:5-(carboxyamino)imidazole ribonucleotide synthase [Legionella israelensis]|uniref:N5-carboxyaminoimidazole ribonucleotide synthase n=1 Tax=Legionella israelensis TaxID=454 RepID=A0A0W0V4I6_9GAMM|nr:5-(carboxyamino)imidazole ribonucleotide synthase [Legionella israelensis]KTD15018.1 phosphoribosylaminoimidazole carboxylase ATPase subunit [Legionella israelensis]QBS09990.1 5-(carboxyamino)imidazole ribonucleotide synthase [Legionella israelensis]SCX77772.1 5-(carboxyamino)imidazole ribonucleotide synthase [Legionella israelensis DSM 19235]STX59565.1 phosphoribosylaminoimidazole carboxylase ATPase subunit [Legionella israelensis]
MKIGILGGGQLSRMLALAGIPIGIDFCFFEPNTPCSAETLGSVVHAEYKDKASLESFAEQVDLITFENENIPLETLSFLEKQSVVYPDKKALQISQDRLLEKNLFRALNIPTTDYFEVNDKVELKAAISETGYPAILKKRRGGYDGKGQFRLYSANDVAELTLEQCQNSILEGWIAFDREVSLIAARNKKGEMVFYDLCENRHEKGILFYTANQRKDPFFSQACDHVTCLMNHLNYVGVLALEFFQQNERLIANEMAPRVHNSGHWTIEGAMTSQFVNHLRCVLDWTPGPTDSLAYATMYNIIGQFPPIEQLAVYPELHIHHYQKQARAGRKLGHVTALSTDSHSRIKVLEELLLFSE